MQIAFEEKFILRYIMVKLQEMSASFPFTNGKTIHLQAENLRSLLLRKLKSSFFEVENFPENNAELNIPQHEEYLQKLEKAIEVIKQNNLPNLVNSRPIAKEISSINFEETYQLLCKKYPIHFVICFITDEEIWIRCNS